MITANRILANTMEKIPIWNTRTMTSMAARCRTRAVRAWTMGSRIRSMPCKMALVTVDTE